MSFGQKLALALVDFLLVLAGLVLALGLRVDFEAAAMSRYLLDSPYLLVYPTVALVTVAAFSLFGLYEKVWRYAGIHELLGMVYAVTWVTLPFLGIVLAGGGVLFPRTGPVIAAFLWLSLCGGLRFLLRIASHRRATAGGHPRRVLIVGANDAGEAIVRELSRGGSGYDPVGFLDADPARRKIRIHGVPVLGAPAQVSELAERYQVSEVILARASPAEVRAVVQASAGRELQLRTVPSLSDVVGGHVQVSQIRQVQIEDLLERDPVQVDLQEAGAWLEGRRVLVTGAGGSIGSEICRQVARLSRSPLILAGRGENSIYEIALELQGHPTVSFIGDVRDRARMAELFRRHRPQVVFHAAAHKHVPLMEQNPVEAVTNNVFGTGLLMDLAEEHGVEKFILLSTDKAVHPTSVMGASKRLAELLLRRRSRPGFAAVRFGNVLGSRGSVIPTFRRQIARGGPVTVTDPEMTRFFMTIPEAVSLVIRAGALAQGGEIYLLDMGRPVRILDLARNMIRLSGYEPEVDIPIELVGARPGEKLHEELTGPGEETRPTSAPKILSLDSPSPPGAWLEEILEGLGGAVALEDEDACRRWLARLEAGWGLPPAASG